MWSAKHIPMVKGKEGSPGHKASHASSNLNAASLLRRLFERLVNPQTYQRSACSCLVLMKALAGWQASLSTTSMCITAFTQDGKAEGKHGSCNEMLGPVPCCFKAALKLFTQVQLHCCSDSHESLKFNCHGCHHSNAAVLVCTATSSATEHAVVQIEVTARLALLPVRC